MTNARNNVVKIILNKSDENDMEYATFYTRCQLKSIGIWPYTCEVSNYQKMARIILIIICCLLMSSAIVSIGLYIVLDEENFQRRLVLIGNISFCIISLIKYTIVLVDDNDIKCCLDKMTTDFRDIDPQDHMIMKKNVDIGRFFTMICSATTFGSTILFNLIMPNFTKNIVDDRNVTLRSLPYPSDYYFLDVQFSPAFEIIYFIQSLVVYIACTIRSGTCSLATNFVTHACGQCEIIVTHINDLVDGYREEFNTLDNRMRDIIQHHSRLIRFVADVEYILNKICVMDLLGCMLNICILGYEFIMAWQDYNTLGTIAYLLLMATVLYNIFIFCYISEFLAQKCQDIGEAAYMIDWHQLPAEKAMNLQMIMNISVRPMNLTAGKCIKLSQRTFTDVLKTAMAYLNILKALTIRS